MAIKHLTPESVDFLDEWNSSTPFITAHTSGSTGTPKTIKLDKYDAASSAKATCRFFGIDNSSVLVCPLSASYIAGKMMIVRAIVSGADLYMEDPHLIPFTKTYPAIDLLPIVPTQLAQTLEMLKQQPIRNILIGGAPLSPDQERLLYDIDTKAYASYGMTETCSHVALRLIAPGNDVYAALPGISFSRDDRDCLVIHRPECSNPILITNDIVELVDESHFRWLGRADNAIITGGLKVIPELVERKIEPHLKAPFYISGVQDDYWGQRVVLNIDCEPGAIDEPTLLVILKQNLLKHEMPKEIVYKRFRYTNGKLSRT